MHWKQLRYSLSSNISIHIKFQQEKAEISVATCPFLDTVHGVCLHVDHPDKVISASNLQLPTAPLLPRGSCSQPIFYVRNIILPNSSSHTGQGKPEPDAIQPLPKRTAAKARTGRHVFLQKGWQTVSTKAAPFENSIPCEFSICNRQKWTQLP